MYCFEQSQVHVRVGLPNETVPEPVPAAKTTFWVTGWCSNRTMTLTGRGEEIVARLKSLEAAGVKQVAIQVVWPHGREMIEDFSREVIARY